MMADRQSQKLKRKNKLKRPEHHKGREKVTRQHQLTEGWTQKHLGLITQVKNIAFKVIETYLYKTSELVIDRCG
jgi:hypothetical protein